MKRELRERRDRVAERHDATLARHPTREGDAFTHEMQAVVAELADVVKTADDPSSDPVEVAKAYRWLGDAYFDLARGKDTAVLGLGAQAYQRSSELLAEAPSPVEQAKLDFNYGNTLRGLSEGADVGLLEAAQTRYERAARAFRAHHLPDLAKTVEEQLKSIDPQLRMARKYAELGRGQPRLEALAKQLETAGPVERERIAAEVKKFNVEASRGDVEGTLEEGLEALREQAERHPERFGEKAAKLSEIEGPIRQLKALVNEFQSDASVSPTKAMPELAMGQLLLRKLDKEAAAGRLSPDRAAKLAAELKAFLAELGKGGDDLDSMAERSEKMRAVMMRVLDAAMSPTWQTEPPKPGSRASVVLPMFQPLRRHLFAEAGRSMTPSEETSERNDLTGRVFKLEARFREAANDDHRIRELEGELWRLAIDVQKHARRYHLLVVQPDFSMAFSHADPKSVFLSANDELQQLAPELSEREGVKFFSAGRGDRAQDRWNQLCSATLAVFDIGVPEGAERAQVCYELGLALALGKPSVVVARPGQILPFDINIRAVYLQGGAKARIQAVAEGIREAVASIVWGGSQAGLGSGPANALALLRGRFGARLSEGVLRIAVERVEHNLGDAVGFRNSLGQLLGMLGADAPAMLLPAWPPVYPDAGRPPRCFHVMPFRPDWSTPTRDLAAKACKANGWVYSRGDEANAQRIIHGIWEEIGGASAVLIDITGHNANVALELGLVHALGRPYRVLAQGDPNQHMFPSLEKVQIHSYGGAPEFLRFSSVVSELLADPSARAASEAWQRSAGKPA